MDLLTLLLGCVCVHFDRNPTCVPNEAYKHRAMLAGTSTGHVGCGTCLAFLYTCIRNYNVSGGIIIMPRVMFCVCV